MSTNAQVAVTTTAAVIHAPSSSAAVKVRNTGATDCYIGGSGVTSANGFLLKANEIVDFSLKGGDAIYARTASGSTTLGVFAPDN